jgi:hypothetical protein
MRKERAGSIFPMSDTLLDVSIIVSSKWYHESELIYPLFLAWFVAADFCFAILPWFVIWDLNMKNKEKITVACGLSLGIL